jgi:AcrR family transcriptional regulator
MDSQMEIRERAIVHPPADAKALIVDAAAAACRQYGPLKTNVADIARVLRKSPASIYKVFPSKAALLDAVAARFFEDYLDPTRADVSQTCARQRLEEIALEQHRLMLQARDNQPQMFDLIARAADGNWPSFRHHLTRFEVTVGELIAAGSAGKTFTREKIAMAASCFCSAIGILWDPRIVEALPSTRCRASASEIASFAIASSMELRD